MGIIGIIVIIVGVITAVIVVVRNFVRSAGAQFEINKAKKGKLNEEKIRAKLDLQFGKAISVPDSFHQPEFKRVISFVQSLRIRNMNILHVHELNLNECLVFTECTFADLMVVSLRGHTANADKKYNVNFIISFNPAKKEIILRSDLFADNYDKQLRDSFRMEIVQYIERLKN